MDKLRFRPISSQPISIVKLKKQSESVSGQGFKQQFQQQLNLQMVSSLLVNMHNCE